ncbi:hypothetical protein L0Z72_15760, partial [candidate division KSB1 bacterium]|nr:hypothetical protein [candidate division KSB1 bacterium]
MWHKISISRRLIFLREVSILVILLVIHKSSAHSQSTYLPLNHWVYDYLERLETRQIIHSVINGSKPLSRQEIAPYLGEARQKIDRLSKVEQDQLNFLTIEFQEELSTAVGQLKPYQTRIQRLRQNKLVQKFIPGILYQNNRNFLSWSEAPF